MLAFIFATSTWLLLLAGGLVAGNLFTLMLLRAADRADRTSRQELLRDIPATRSGHLALRRTRRLSA